MKRILEHIKKLSTCKRHAVSAAVFHPHANGSIAVGWNWSKNCSGEVGGCGCIHAEPMSLGIEGFRLWVPSGRFCDVCMADIEQACRRGRSIMWTSLSPCGFCLDEIATFNEGITKAREDASWRIGIVIYTEASRHGVIQRPGISQYRSECKCMEIL